MSIIEKLAVDVLNVQELKLAKHLDLLLSDDSFNLGPLIEDILPIYWTKVGDVLENLQPSNIYRPLYYIHLTIKNNTRAYMRTYSNHLEGCLQQLTPKPRKSRGFSNTFGPVVVNLSKRGVIPPSLSSQLFRFNEVINVPSKHPGVYIPTNRLDERTFSVSDIAYAFVIMRMLSIGLFSLLKGAGVFLPEEWPVFKDEWLSYFNKV